MLKCFETDFMILSKGVQDRGSSYLGNSSDLQDVKLQETHHQIFLRLFPADLNEGGRSKRGILHSDEDDSTNSSSDNDNDDSYAS